MNEQEWAIRNNNKHMELLKKIPKTQKEKDIWNLKWNLYGIGKDSRYYRMGMVKTLRRVIKTLESEP